MKSTILVLGALFAAVTPAAAQLHIIKSFAKGGAKMELAVFKGPKGKAGILGMVGAKRNSYGLNIAAFDGFTELVNKVVKTESVQWRFVGAITEIDTRSPSHLVVYAGPTVQFIVIDPSIGVNSFELDWSDLDAFKAASAEVRKDIAAP